MTTIKADTSALVGVFHAITGGKFRVRLRESESRSRWGYVLDDDNNIIGSASDYIYGGAGWCIETAAYHGHAKLDQVVIVD